MQLWVLEKGCDIGIAILEVVEALRHSETYRQNWHTHEEALELHCVFSGAISYEFGDVHPAVTIPGGIYSCDSSRRASPCREYGGRAVRAVGDTLVTAVRKDPILSVFALGVEGSLSGGWCAAL